MIVTVISRCKDSYPLWFLLWSFIQKGPGQLYLACKYSWPGRSHLQGFALQPAFSLGLLISSRLKSDDVKSRLASSSASPWLHLWVNNWCRFWGYWKAVAAHLTKRSICFELSLSHAIYFPSSLCGFDLAETAARFLYLFHAELQGSLWLWQTQSFKYSTQRNLAFIRMMFYPPALVHQSACVLASCYFLIASYCIDFLWLVGSWLQTRACSLPLVVPDYHNTAQVHQTAVQVFIF